MAKKIFISWSKQYSKEIAKGLKEVLENHIFLGSELECFVSDVDISSGEDWWVTISEELKASALGILCVTKENVKEPWIYYEAGALVGNNVTTIPLLVSCDAKSLEHSPINGKQCVQFYDESKFVHMIIDINEKIRLLSLQKEQLETLALSGYRLMKENLKGVLGVLKASKYFNENYIYPGKITTVNTGTVYLSAPMSGLTDEEYAKQRDFLLELRKLLLSDMIGFRDVICPAISAESKDDFDGMTKALKENFIHLKQVDNVIILYPNLTPSSVLIEVGYAIGLTKHTIIFYRTELPYMLVEAGENISHVRTVSCSSFEHILKYITTNGRAIFKLDYDD